MTPRRHPPPTTIVIHADTTSPVDAVLLAARLRGCVCRPDVELGQIIATVRHDAWCPLLRAQDRN